MHMNDAMYISSITWNSISGLDSWYDFRFRVNCAVAVKVRSRKHFSQVIYCTPYRKSSSIEGRLPLKVVFPRRSSSVGGRLPLKVVFHQRSSSIEGLLPSKVVFHQRSSSVNGRPPSVITIPLWWFGRFCSRKGSNPRLLGILSHFRWISFLIRALLLWEK